MSTSDVSVDWLSSGADLILKTTWTDPAANILVYCMGFYLLTEVCMAAYRRKSIRMQALSSTPARKIVVRTIHLAVATMGFIAMLANGMPILLLRDRSWTSVSSKDGVDTGVVQLEGPQAHSFRYVLAITITPFLSFIVFKLAYRTETPFHLAFQHVSAVLGSLFVLWSMQHTAVVDDRGLTLQAAVLFVWLLSEGLTGTALRHTVPRVDVSDLNACLFQITWHMSL